MDIVCFYAEIGMGDGYRVLMERMTASAREVMPDARLLLIAPDGVSTDIRKLFDKTARYPDATARDDLIYHKGRAMLTLGLATDNVTAFVDPDIVFQKPIIEPDAFDLGLLWRNARADQPVNAGLIITRPHQHKFWLKFGQVLEALPAKNRRWYCEQIALSLVTGVCHKAGETFDILGSRVRLLDTVEHCSLPEFADETTRAIHFKDARKGDGWEGMSPKKEAA